MAFEVAYAAGAIVVGVVFVVSRTIFGSRNSSNDNRTRARSMSFGSSALRNGAFPAKTNVWPPIVNTIFYYKTCPSVDDLVYCCRSLLEYDRFRSIAIKEKGNWVFKDIGDSIDIKRDLIETYTVKNVAERMAKIDEIVADNLENQPMKPLWKIIRIISEDDSNDVILSRVHHVYGDGMSLVIAMTKMFTDGNGQPFSVGAAQKVREKRNKDKSKEQVQAKPSMFTTEKIWRALKATFEVLMLPNTSYDSNTKFTVPDQRKMVMSNRRKTVLFPTVQLDFVKEIKNKAGVTVNDVLFTATAGAIARYCKWKKDPVIDSPKLFSRALMPVAFPRKKEEIESTSNALRNYWSMISVKMPISTAPAIQKLQDCAKITTELKKSPAALLQLWIQNTIISRMPEFLQRQIAFDVFSRHTMVFSNVPGPSESVLFRGEKLLGMHVIFPNILPQVIIISYANNVFFTMTIDDEQFPDSAEMLPKFYLEELEEMAKGYGIVCTSNEMLSKPYE